MFFLRFLQDKIDPRDVVAHDFVEKMIPALLENYSDTSAKGGDHTRDNDYPEDVRRKFEAKFDQSMVSHQLNGIFPTLRLINILEAEQLANPFSELERRIYILSYLWHDIDKLIPERLETRDVEDRARAYQLVQKEMERCNVEAFFPQYIDYLPDITYLIVNTQRKYGTHTPTYGWNLRLRERRVRQLERLCTFSDCIAYLVTSPASILNETETQNLSTILTELGSETGPENDILVFTYHQLREVRGLFTNVINNGLIDLLSKEGEHVREGIWPFLFFSNGVIYLKRQSLQLQLTSKDVVGEVEASLKKICAGRIKNHAPGFKFDPKGIAKHPDYYFEFLDVEEYITLLVESTIRRTANDVSAGPLEKIRQMQIAGEIAADLPTNFHPDLRITMLARFFSVVFAGLLALIDESSKPLQKQVEQAVIAQLDLAKYWEHGKTIPNKGGFEYRWFWLAACYLDDHRGLDPKGEGQDSLRNNFRQVGTLIQELAGLEIQQQFPRRYLNHLSHYLDSIIELPASIKAGEALPDFQAELERYTKGKSKKRTLLCTLCNSAYPTEEQSDQAVLFQPWVYKNKLPLYAGKNAGGFCSICALELMLRQILQKSPSRLTGGKFEALKTKYLTIYPNFFFTPETGNLVQGIIDQLQDINFFTIRRQLDGRLLTFKDLLELDAFAPPPPSTSEPEGSIHEDVDDDKGEELDQPGVGHERSFIKFEFERGSFPGLSIIGMRKGQDEDDTSAWAMPAFLALALPLVASVKVVASEMAIPLYSSGHDFRETVILDAPHPFLTRLLRSKSLRVNQLFRHLRLLASIYRVNLDTFAKSGKPEWKHLSAIARDLETDPLHLFSYLFKQQRRDQGLSPRQAREYVEIFQQGLEADMSKIEHCVDNYVKFYRGSYQSHSILRPVDIVAKAIIKSPLDVEPEDLLLMIRGEIKNWMDRVRSHQATGYAVCWGKDVSLKEEPAIKVFVEGFYQEIFLDYCQGERGILRSRINSLKNGCEAYYTSLVLAKRIQDKPDQPEDVSSGDARGDQSLDQGVGHGPTDTPSLLSQPTGDKSPATISVEKN